MINCGNAPQPPHSELRPKRTLVEQPFPAHRTTSQEKKEPCHTLSICLWGKEAVRRVRKVREVEGEAPGGEGETPAKSCRTNLAGRAVGGHELLRKTSSAAAAGVRVFSLECAESAMAPYNETNLSKTTNNESLRYCEASGMLTLRLRRILGRELGECRPLTVMPK